MLFVSISFRLGTQHEPIFSVEYGIYGCYPFVRPSLGNGKSGLIRRITPKHACYPLFILLLCIKFKVGVISLFHYDLGGREYFDEISSIDYCVFRLLCNTPSIPII